MLEVESLTTRYGAIAAIREVGLTVRAGEVVCLIGPNGAGKTTLLWPPVAGLAEVFQRTRSHSAATTLRIGLQIGFSVLVLALVPEHRRIFADLTVNENLMVGWCDQDRFQ